MPQSIAEIYVHLVFSTLGRAPFLGDAEVRSGMHAYITGTSNGLRCPAIKVGGTEDHVHVLARLGKETSTSAWVRELKKSSNSWARQQESLDTKFAWQAGYGAFSTDPSRLQQLIRYVDNQEEHHRHVSFQDELRQLFRECGVELDERYAWD